MSRVDLRMRDDYRELLAGAGVVRQNVYLATDRETVLRRMRARRGGHADDVVLPEELTAEYFGHVEPPTPEEGPLTVVREPDQGDGDPENGMRAAPHEP